MLKGNIIRTLVYCQHATSLMRVLFMSLVIHYWTRDVQNSQDVSMPLNITCLTVSLITTF